MAQKRKIFGFRLLHISEKKEMKLKLKNALETYKGF